jgi:hypothetical protein
MNTQLQERKVDFVSLNKKVLAEYVFVFKVNDAYTITDLNQVHDKHQLLIQGLENKNQQLNLMFVDSVFFNILSDVVLEVLLNKAHSFNQYMALNTNCISFIGNDECKYLEYKFMDFIHFMLYSNFASTMPYNGETDLNRIYCLKSINEEIEYFSIYEQFALKKKLLDDLILFIDYAKSTIVGDTVRLCLKIQTKPQTSNNLI